MLLQFLINVVIVFFLLLIFSLLGAIVFPTLPTTATAVGAFGSELVLLILPVIIMALVGYFLGRGIRSIKSPWEAMGLTYISAFLLGGVLGLLTVLNFSYSAHVKFDWLGGAWYGSLFTIFLIGAPITLAFLT